MKTIIRSRVFLIITCGIFFTSLGISAANMYNASDITYIKDGIETNVNEVLDELYNDQASKIGAVHCGSYTANGSFDITTYGLSEVDISKFVFVPKQGDLGYVFANPAHIGYGYNKDYVYVRGCAKYIAHTFSINGNVLSFTLPYIDAVAMNGPEAASANVAVGGRVNITVAGDIYYIG